ncbi:alpha/beta hydrolase [Kribbella sp. CA-245084]|uniref:alpha/beta hydrolase n=1 Tax=Kribbella sp. CA-245084 TaxID=3239940 RepID=UPI003D9451F4
MFNGWKGSDINHTSSARDPEPRASVLVLPGGGYRHHAAHEAEDYADWLSRLGFDAVVLRYAVGANAWPKALEEARDTLAWMRERAGEATPVGVIGSSAGGHLAAALSTATCPEAGPTGRPDFCILAYPLISFEVQPHPGTTATVLGHQPTDQSRQQVSADRHVDTATPPTFIWTTADDASVHPAHALRYAEALTTAGVPVELHVFPHGVHGLGLAANDPVVSAWTTLCERWLTGLLGN